MIGTVKGPPTSFQQTLFTTIIILAALIGSGVSIIVILKGNWAQRLVILGPLLLFLSVLVAFVYQVVLSGTL